MVKLRQLLPSGNSKGLKGRHFRGFALSCRVPFVSGASRSAKRSPNGVASVSLVPYVPCLRRVACAWLARVCEVKRTPNLKRTSGDNRRDIRDTRDQSDGKVKAQALIKQGLVLVKLRPILPPGISKGLKGRHFRGFAQSLPRPFCLRGQ